MGKKRANQPGYMKAKGKDGRIIWVPKKTGSALKKKDFLRYLSFDERTVKAFKNFNSHHPDLNVSLNRRTEHEHKSISLDCITISDKNSKVIAYLKIGYLNKNIFYEKCPSFYHYKEMWKGYPLGLYDYKTEKPLPVTNNTINKFTKKEWKQTEEDMNDNLNFFVYPYVDYAKVTASYWSKGVSDAMYETAAEIYGGIFGSGLQSDSAKNMWERFSANEKYVEMIQERKDETIVRCGLVHDQNVLDNLAYETPVLTDFDFVNPSSLIEDY